MFEAAITAGCLESGADVYQVGYTSTPSVSYLVSNYGFSCGVMISASHNPYYDNGIKVFNSNGTKLAGELEDLIEEYFDNELNLEKAESSKIGRLVDYKEGIELYLDHLEKVAHPKLSQYRIALDLANGSSCFTAPKLFKRLNANVDFYFNNPDGLNINNDCGSTHLNQLQEIMKTGKYDVGFAFDGDADRVLAVNSKGEVVDGDGFMYVCGKYLANNGELYDNTVVTTVMSNIGLFKALNRQGLKAEKTQVGDKYVFECMEKNGYTFGGEQSGHLIFRKHAATGDGLMSALLMLEIMAHEGKNLEELTKDLKIYPQLLKNVRVKDKKIMNDQNLEKLINQISEKLGDEGRVLVRTSGTEPLIRVMVEAATSELCSNYVNEMVELIEDINSKIE